MSYMIYTDQLYPINSFNQAKALYESIKPVRYTNTYKMACKELRDTRPIGERRRQWERIVKLSNNAYGITESYMAYQWWDDRFRHEGFKDRAERERACALVFRKHRDGSETVTIRMPRWGGDISCVRLLDHILPYGMTIGRDRGRVYVSIRTGVGPSEAYGLLPHTTLFSYEEKRSYNMSYPTKDDGHKAVFRNEGDGNWSFVGGKVMDVSKPREYVDTDLKRKYAPSIQEFKEWADALLPLLKDGGGSYEDVEEPLRKLLAERQDLVRPQYRKDRTSGVYLNPRTFEYRVKNLGKYMYGDAGISQGAITSMFSLVTVEARREALTDPEHPMRLILLHSLARYMRNCNEEYRYMPASYSSRVQRVIVEPEDKKKKAQFNRFINYFGGFVARAVV